MFASCCGEPFASRGFKLGLKRISAPPIVRTTISPCSYFASFGLSAKVLEVLIPRIDDKFLVSFRKYFSSRQFAHFETLRLPQLDIGSNLKNRFSCPVTNVDVNR